MALERWTGNTELSKQAGQAQLAFEAARNAEALRYARIEMRMATVRMTVNGVVNLVTLAEARVASCPAAAEPVAHVMELGLAGIGMEVSGLGDHLRRF